MNLYNDYLNEISERKKQNLQPKPIDDGDLIKELILNIEDENNINKKDSLNFLIYNTLPGTTSAAVQKSKFLKDLPKPNAEEISCYIYTSGSTGKPKGVMLSHKNLASNLSDYWKVLGNTESHTISGVLPLFHSFLFSHHTLMMKK